MILDATLTLSENQSVLVTAISANVIEFPLNDAVPYEAAAVLRNLGPGTDMPMLVQVTEAFNNLTTVTFTLESADNAALSTAPVVHATSGAIPLASLVPGFRPPMGRILPDGVMKRYLGMRYTLAGTAPTTGKITAALATEIS